jgi:hypothetical protein
MFNSELLNYQRVTIKTVEMKPGTWIWLLIRVANVKSKV